MKSKKPKSKSTWAAPIVHH